MNNNSKPVEYYLIACSVVSHISRIVSLSAADEEAVRGCFIRHNHTVAMIRQHVQQEAG